MTSLNWPENPPSLTDGTVTLRAWAAGDVDDVYRACQDPVMQLAIALPVPYLRDHAKGFVEGFAPQQWADRQGAPFAAMDAETTQLLAAPSLKAVDPLTLSAEVGYWVAPWARGRKVAQRSARLVCDWAFTGLGLRRLEFFIDTTNVASCAVAERVGAVRENVTVRAAAAGGRSRHVARYALEK
jgi:RimJ/RimL family protein N-acetyltransferase